MSAVVQGRKPHWLEATLAAKHRCRSACCNHTSHGEALEALGFRTRGRTQAEINPNNIADHVASITEILPLCLQ